MPTKTLNYLTQSITWQRTSDSHYPFAAKVDGDECSIRLNDFPDEHLYTLLVNGEEVVSFDDWSANWTRSAKEKAVIESRSLNFK